MPMETKLVNFVLFNGTNYATWKIQYKRALIKNGLWNIGNKTDCSQSQKQHYT